MNVLFMLLLTLFTRPSLEDVKVELFTIWGSEASIPMVSFGLPTDKEMQEVQAIVDSIEKQIIQSSGTSLSKQERELERPFLLGMIEGLQLQMDSELATVCLQHLEEELDNSGLYRMFKMHCFILIYPRNQT